MTIIYLLIGISVSVASVFLGAFLWAVRSGQYEDDYTPSVRMLFDEEPDNPGRKISKINPLQGGRPLTNGQA